jgi:hypothetical protein
VAGELGVEGGGLIADFAGGSGPGLDTGAGFGGTFPALLAVDFAGGAPLFEGVFFFFVSSSSSSKKSEESSGASESESSDPFAFADFFFPIRAKCPPHFQTTSILRP